MPDKLVGLLGTGVGPRMHTGRMPNLVARVVGLNDGVVRITHDQGVDTMLASGEMTLPDTEFVQFEYRGPNKQLICTLLSKARDAVHSP